MNRRSLIALLGSAATWPLAARALSSDTMPRVGVLAANSENEVEAQARNAAFRESLDKLGWTDGRNIRIDYRWGAAASERALTYAEELISLMPNAILASNSSCADASRRYSSTVLLKANLRPIDIRREDGRMCSAESRNPTFPGAPAPLSKTPAISRFSRRARSRFTFCAKRREIAARLGRMGPRDGGPARRGCWSCARA
jgi:hypothetical protein